MTKGSQVNTNEENSGIRPLEVPWPPLTHNLFQFNSAPEIRSAEIYYALAECKFRGGDVNGAATLLDAVRKRNYPDDIWETVSYVSASSYVPAESRACSNARVYRHQPGADSAVCWLGPSCNHRAWDKIAASALSALCASHYLCRQARDTAWTKPSVM